MEKADLPVAIQTTKPLLCRYRRWLILGWDISCCELSNVPSRSSATILNFFCVTVDDVAVCCCVVSMSVMICVDDVDLFCCNIGWDGRWECVADNEDNNNFEHK